MRVYYSPRVVTDDAAKQRQAADAAHLKLELIQGAALPKDCRVLIQHERYTADFRDTRLRPFVLYVRSPKGGRKYRACFKHLDIAATAAHKLAAYLEAQDSN